MELSLSERLRIRLGRTGSLSIIGPKSPRKNDDNNNNNNNTNAGISSISSNKNGKKKRKAKRETESKSKEMKLIQRIWTLILKYTSDYDKKHSKQQLKKKLLAFSLSDIKFCATFFNYTDDGWQHITSKQHRIQLVDEIYISIHEIYLFRENVIKCIGKSKKQINKLKNNKYTTIYRKIEDSYKSSIHIIPSGSGVLVDISTSEEEGKKKDNGTTYSSNNDSLIILTCSHCIYEGDAEEDIDDEGNGRRSKRRKVNDKKEESNCDDNKKKVNNHKGRYKIMIFSDGSLHVAQCIYNNDRCDVAFLKVIDLLDSNENNSNGSSNSKILLSSSKNNGKLLSASSSSTATNTTTTSTNNNITRDDDDSIRNSNIKVVQISNSCAKAGDDVYCIHNPYDWDLELAQGARPRRNGFNPFTISPGDIDGYMDDDDDIDDNSRIEVRNDLGQLMHSCWTYWGSSGAPIFNANNGHVVGIHNSWDPNCGQRHGVGIEGIKFALDEMMSLK